MTDDESNPKSEIPASQSLSVVLPAFNEADAIAGVIGEVWDSLAGWSGEAEIIVVDDASSDGTGTVAAALGVRVVRHIEKGGYGKAVKTGVEAANGELVALLDADGSYDARHLRELLALLPPYDLVNGARTSEQGSLRWLRRPAKWLIRKLAEWVSGKRILDPNTGMKVFKRELLLRYRWVLPDGFSCSTSITLAFLCNGHAVKFIPINYRRRIGASKFRPLRDTAQYIATVIRIVMYFRPLRVFLPLSLAMFATAVVKAAVSAMYSPTGLHDADILLFVTALLVAVVGLLADVIVAQRRNGT